MKYSGIDLHSTDGLQAAGYRVHLANTAAMKRYEPFDVKRCFA